MSELFAMPENISKGAYTQRNFRLYYSYAFLVKLVIFSIVEIMIGRVSCMRSIKTILILKFIFLIFP